MPSGSKKRKSSKKPKPEGGPPELEAGLEEAMENNGVEVGEATPSPRGFEGDPEAMAERGFEGKEMNGEVPQEGDAVPEAPKEGFQIDEAAPDQDESGQGDPPSQAEPEPEIPARIEAEAPAVFELEGEPAPQGETEPQTDTPLMEFEAKTDAAPEEIKPETESDAAPAELEPATDATPDASPDEIKPHADISLDEVESSKESSILERESVFDAAPIGNESGMDESSVEVETKTDAASADIEPEIDKALDEIKSETDAAPAEVASEISEPLVEVKPEVDATPYIELETNDAPDEVPVEAEPETDGAPAKSKPEMEEVQVEELECAAPADIEPETEEAPMERELETDVPPTDVEAEADEALAERELVDVEPVMDAAPADTEAETDTAQVKIDASPDEIPPEIDAVSPENETVEIEPDVKASQAEIEAAPEPEPEVEALVEGEPEVSAEDVDNSAEFEAKTEPPQETELEPKPLDVAEDMSLEPPQEIESLDVAEDTSLEPPQEIEPESEVAATDEAKPEDEASVETKAEERGSVETESDQQDVVEGERGAPPEIDPEPEVETSRGIELDAEAEVPLEAEPEPVAEAPKPDGKGHIKTESDQQDLGEIEPDQSGVKEHDQQLQKQEGEAELDTSVSEDNQSSGLQLQVADASEVPVIDDKPPAISASDEGNSVDDDSTSSALSSEASDNANNERTAIEREPEGDDIPPSVTALEGEGESTVEGVSDNLDVGHDEDGAVLASAGNGSETEESSKQELAIELPPADVEESAKEDITEQERAVDVGHDEDGAALASSGNGGDAEESNEQELAIELPPADVEESAKEDISEQERAVDVGHDEDGAVLASAGNGGEVEVSSEQELGIELPPADVVDVEEFAKEPPPPSDQELVTELRQPLIDEQDLSQGLGAAADDPPSAESEQSLNATLPSSESKMTSDASAPQDEAVTPANDEKVASEHEFNLESACDELDRDIGEEEAASSTVAEAGSVLNDFDERASYEQELPTIFPSTDQDVDIASVESEQSLNATSESEMTSHAPEPQDEAEFNLESACGELERDIGEEEAASSTVAEAGSVPHDFDERASSYEQELLTDFPPTDQDVDIPDFKEFGDNLSTEAHESETGLREQLDSEPSPAEKDHANAACRLEATSEQQEVLLEGAEAAKPAEDIRSALVEEVLSDEQLLSSSQPEQVFQDSGEDKVHSSEEIVLANEELRTGEEETATCEDGKMAANSILGTSLPMIAGDELISKAFTYLENGQQSLSSSEGPSNELLEHIDESSVYHSKANNTDKAEIHAIDTKELKEAEHSPMGGDTNYDADEAPVESASLIPEGRDMKGVQAFRQESTQEASLPVVVPAQDRALEHVSLKSAERPSGGGTLEHRTKLLGCCGMFDLLLRRN